MSFLMEMKIPGKQAFECVYLFSQTNLPQFQKERKLLQNKRLDLDAAKTRLKKAKVAEARAAVSRIFFDLSITFKLIDVFL